MWGVNVVQEDEDPGPVLVFVEADGRDGLHAIGREPSNGVSQAGVRGHATGLQCFQQVAHGERAARVDHRYPPNVNTRGRIRFAAALTGRPRPEEPGRGLVGSDAEDRGRGLEGRVGFDGRLPEVARELLAVVRDHLLELEPLLGFEGLSLAELGGELAAVDGVAAHPALAVAVLRGEGGLLVGRLAILHDQGALPDEVRVLGQAILDLGLAEERVARCVVRRHRHHLRPWIRRALSDLRRPLGEGFPFKIPSSILKGNCGRGRKSGDPRRIRLWR